MAFFKVYCGIKVEVYPTVYACVSKVLYSTIFALFEKSYFRIQEHSCLPRRTFLKRKILVKRSSNQRMPLFSLLLLWWVCNWYFLRWLLYFTNTNISVAGAEFLHNQTKVYLLIILLYLYLNKRPECSCSCGRLSW